MLHIDGDMIAYRIACAIGDEGDGEAVGWTINSFMAKNILQHFDELEPYHVYLSGRTNFRDDVAVTAPYKGNRDKPKPLHLKAARQHLMDVWSAVVYEGIEADDAIATAATADGGTVVSLDKDFDQLTNPIFNFVTFKTRQATQLEATKTLYKQILTGDAVDNIIGVEGCGPGMAGDLIDGCTKEVDMFLICLDQMGRDRMKENADLVFLQRDDKLGRTFMNFLDYSVIQAVEENT
jgi:5'-3' exonuclease